MTLTTNTSRPNHTATHTASPGSTPGATRYTAHGFQRPPGHSTGQSPGHSTGQTPGQANAPARSRPARIENVQLLEAEFTNILRDRIGLNHRFAAEWAQELVDGMRQTYGGKNIHIPAPDKTRRDAAIFAQYNGTNTAEILRTYGISRTRMFDILEEQRALKKAAAKPV